MLISEYDQGDRGIGPHFCTQCDHFSSVSESTNLLTKITNNVQITIRGDDVNGGELHRYRPQTI